MKLNRKSTQLLRCSSRARAPLPAGLFNPCSGPCGTGSSSLPPTPATAPSRPARDSGIFHPSSRRRLTILPSTSALKPIPPVKGARTFDGLAGRRERARGRVATRLTPGCRGRASVSAEWTPRSPATTWRVSAVHFTAQRGRPGPNSWREKRACSICCKPFHSAKKNGLPLKVGSNRWKNCASNSQIF